MSAYNVIFKRVEKKYKITEEAYGQLLTLISDRLIPDKYGKSTICSLYLDTPDFRLIRNSIEAIAYKEKLRFRSYGLPERDRPVFFELKKKYKGTVYKRRVSMTYEEAKKYIYEGIKPFDSQIMRELDYAMTLYGRPKPAAMILYEREAFFVKDLPALRLTFDRNVRYRFSDLTPEGGDGGTRLLPDGFVLLEVKTDGAMPVWLSRALDTCHIYPTKFSKYGKSYLECLQNKKGDHTYV